MQVHLQLMLVCGGRQLQLIRVENRLECRSDPFQTQVTTPNYSYWIYLSSPSALDLFTWPASHTTTSAITQAACLSNVLSRHAVRASSQHIILKKRLAFLWWVFHVLNAWPMPMA